MTCSIIDILSASIFCGLRCSKIYIQTPSNGARQAEILLYCKSIPDNFGRFSWDSFRYNFASPIKVIVASVYVLIVIPVEARFMQVSMQSNLRVNNYIDKTERYFFNVYRGLTIDSGSLPSTFG